MLSRFSRVNSVRSHGLPDSFVHGILQARILEWVAISFSKDDGDAYLKTHIHKSILES